MKISPLTLFLLVCAAPTFAALPGADLIAHYRFDTNGNDALGRSPPFVVDLDDLSRAGLAFTTTPGVTNSPFIHGVLYVSGRYEPNGQRVNYLSTAPIGDLRYESFTVSLDFYPLPTPRGLTKLEAILDSWTRGFYARCIGLDRNVSNAQNLLTGGYSYRWFGLNREHGVLNLTLNNQAFLHPYNTAAVKPGQWHNLICSFDLQRRQIRTMFDGQLLEPITLPPDFKLHVIGTSFDAADGEFTFANYSNGSVFFGYAAHFRILARALAEPELASLYSELSSELPNFPARHFPWVSVLLLMALAGPIFLFLLRLRKRLRSAPNRPVPNPT